MGEPQIDEAALLEARAAYLRTVMNGNPASDLIVAIRAAVRAYLTYLPGPNGTER